MDASKTEAAPSKECSVGSVERGRNNLPRTTIELFDQALTATNGVFSVEERVCKSAGQRTSLRSINAGQPACSFVSFKISFLCRSDSYIYLLRTLVWLTKGWRGEFAEAAKVRVLRLFCSRAIFSFVFATVLWLGTANIRRVGRNRAKKFGRRIICIESSFLIR